MRILIVRIGRAGDIVMTTPALKALIQRFPEANFTLLTSPDGKRLLKDYHSAISKIWVWDRSRLGSSFEKTKISAQVNDSHFDSIFCFETSTSILKLFDASGAKIYQPEFTGQLTHASRLYLNMVEKACGETIKDVYANLPVSSLAREQLRDEFRRIDIDDSSLVIAIHPSFSGYSRLPFFKRRTRRNKLWPVQSFAALGRRLHEYTLPDGRHPVLIIDLLKQEASLGKRIVMQSGNSIKLLTEAPDMQRYKALLQRADLLVSPDTGPMHIAAALNTRIVALFSGKSPEDCGPFMPQDRFIALRADNRESTQTGIAAISVDAVYQACMQQLSAIQQHKEHSHDHTT